MAFFPRNFYNNDASFTPLFRLLDDFDKYSNPGHVQGQTGRRVNIWQPKFDVRETADAYELHGEVPGVNKENVHIEFTEPQSLVIRGKTERSYTAGTPPAGLVKDSETGAITEGDEAPKSPSHRATVEDENEAIAHESGTVARQDEKSTEKRQEKPADHARYWVSERTIGEFSRTFNFPTRVDQDNVTANFKDGILSIFVPKAKKHESRRIAIN